MEKEVSVAGYTLGIISIVLAFFTPIAGLIFGIIGFNISKKQKSEIAVKGKKYSKIGIILSIIFLVLFSALSIYVAMNQVGGVPGIAGSVIG